MTDIAIYLPLAGNGRQAQYACQHLHHYVRPHFDRLNYSSHVYLDTSGLSSDARDSWENEAFTPDGWATLLEPSQRSVLSAGESLLHGAEMLTPYLSGTRLLMWLPLYFDVTPHPLGSRALAQALQSFMEGRHTCVVPQPSGLTPLLPVPLLPVLEEQYPYLPRNSQGYWLKPEAWLAALTSEDFSRLHRQTDLAVLAQVWQRDPHGCHKVFGLDGWLEAFSQSELHGQGAADTYPEIFHPASSPEGRFNGVRLEWMRRVLAGDTHDLESWGWR